ncbi:MAG: NAD(P)/FAD-dependent oxidoreductase, partial [Deltaproteobacteria bacterium]|nr:NAD(P)/FAD-dependent oxidoreductase [Deltaproteobacteria bacterium]
MSDMDVIIIGAGVAGLTCGCLLAQKGLNVLIVEKNQKIGGCCSSFQKEGFSFDLSVQSLGECQEGGRIWNLLKQLGILHHLRFIPLEPAREYHFPDQTIAQSSQLETHIENLSRVFPEEKKGIRQIYEILRKIFDEFSHVPSSLNWFDPSSLSLQFPFLLKYKDQTFGQLLDEHISHPFLKTILSIRTSYALLPPEEISAVGMAGIEMSYFNHGVSCVDGKVEQFPLAMGEAFKKIGGKMITRQEVEKIIMNKKEAIGIKLTDGQELTGKVVVSNIDAQTTFSTLLSEDSIPMGYRSKLKGMRPSLSYFILYLGIDGSLEEISVSNNEVFPDHQISQEYQALYENRIPDGAPFYLLAPSKVKNSHAPEGKGTLCLSMKAPYHFSRGWDQKTIDELSEYLISRASLLIPDLKKRIVVKA